MRLGLVIRTMGAASSAELVTAAARAADASPALDDLWVVDHIAIPPDDAEGSEGRYLDPLATLAYLAGVTRRIGLGTGVLVLPYRPALPTAKSVATIQELSGGRLSLGVGIGWMAAEFRALGIDPRQRGRITDATLEFLDRCFADDVVEANGQRFYFRPRPARPTLFIGGSPPHAFRRALAHRAGWMPMASSPDALSGPIAQLRTQAAAAGQAPPEVAAMTRLPIDDPRKARRLIDDYAKVGVTRLAHAERYTALADVERALHGIARAAADVG